MHDFFRAFMLAARVLAITDYFGLLFDRWQVHRFLAIIVAMKGTFLPRTAPDPKL